MSPASYQTAPPRVAWESGKRDSNPRPQPWQGCALATELFPRKRVQSNRRTPVRTRRLGAWDLCGGEGDRTPDLVNAIHALSQLSYAPRILGPGKTRSGGNTASYRDVPVVSSDLAPRHELFVLWPVSQDDPGPIAMPKHMRRKKTTSPARAKPRAAPRPTAAAAGQLEPKAKPAKKRGRRRGLLAGLGTHEHERDILDQYLHEVSKTPLLTQKEEIALARKVRAGDQESMQELVKRNLRFVISVAKKYQNRGLPLTDLIGEGNVGLLTAARKFDPDQGVKFISYAVWWIRQAILAALARQGRTVRVPLNRTADLSRIVRTAEYLRQTLRREPTPEEIADATRLSLEVVQSLAALNTGDVRLDAPLDPDGDRSLIERFIAEDLPDTEDQAMDRFLSDEIESALNTLQRRDAKVLRLYFGLDGGREHTLEEIGGMLGVTRERVRQLRDRALKRLRDGDVGKALASFAA